MGCSFLVQSSCDLPSRTGTAPRPPWLGGAQKLLLDETCVIDIGTLLVSSLLSALATLIQAALGLRFGLWSHLIYFLIFHGTLTVTGVSGRMAGDLLLLPFITSFLGPSLGKRRTGAELKSNIDEPGTVWSK